MKRTLFAAILLFVAAPAFAAPMWIERRLILAPALVAQEFATFDDTSATEVDHAPWAAFLKRHVVVGDDGLNRVAYGEAGPAARALLGAYIDALQSVEPVRLSRAEAFAFWINLYNAATVAAVVDAYPVASIRDIDGVWSAKRLNVAGVSLSLGDVEHHVIRAAFDDARAHYALNCASVGCPNLATVPYEGVTLDAMLDAAARAYVNDPRGLRVDDGRIVASKIFGWYQDDFGGDDRAVREHILKYAAPGLAAAIAQAPGGFSYFYDWSLNDADAPAGD